MNQLTIQLPSCASSYFLFSNPYLCRPDSNNRTKTLFKTLVLYLCVCRLTSVSAGFCILPLAVLHCFSSPLQLVKLHVNMVKKKKKASKRKQQVTQTIRQYLPRTLTVDGGYLSPTSNTLLPHSFFHSSHFCRFSSFTIKASGGGKRMTPAKLLDGFKCKTSAGSAEQTGATAN